MFTGSYVVRDRTVGRARVPCADRGMGIVLSASSLYKWRVGGGPLRGPPGYPLRSGLCINTCAMLIVVGSPDKRDDTVTYSTLYPQ